MLLLNYLPVMRKPCCRSENRAMPL